MHDGLWDLQDTIPGYRSKLGQGSVQNASGNSAAEEVNKLTEDVLISGGCNAIPKKHWIPFTRFIERHDDFYQLVAISAFVEARLHKIKPANVTLSDRVSRG